MCFLPALAHIPPFIPSVSKYAIYWLSQFLTRLNMRDAQKRLQSLDPSSREPSTTKNVNYTFIGSWIKMLVTSAINVLAEQCPSNSSGEEWLQILYISGPRLFSWATLHVYDCQKNRWWRTIFDGLYITRGKLGERDRGKRRMWEVRRMRAGFRKVEHSFDDNERICNHDYIVQDPAVS